MQHHNAARAGIKRPLNVLRLGVIFLKRQRHLGKLCGLRICKAGRHARKPGDAGAKEFATTTDTLGKNKLWAALPFVANQRLIPYEMEMTYGSPSAAMAFLDVVQKSFTS